MNPEEPSFCLTPMNFLEIRVPCRFGGAKQKLPDTSFLLGQEEFADVFMGWDFTGLTFLVAAKTRKVQSSYPDLGRGDSFEVMIDTRNVKSPVTTKFCHHFFFLVEPVDDLVAGEKTRFRGEESHEMAHEEVFLVDTKKTASGYQMKVFIPREALFGFDPEGYREIGFNYRLNRFAGAPQEFSASSREFSVEHHPYLWSTVYLEGYDVS